MWLNTHQFQSTFFLLVLRLSEKIWPNFFLRIIFIAHRRSNYEQSKRNGLEMILIEKLSKNVRMK